MTPKKDMVIHINAEDARISVEEEKDGVVSYKEIAPETLFECIKRGLIAEGVHSGMLPPNCLSVAMKSDGTQDVCLWHPERYADIAYYQTAYPRFPLPQLVFGFHVASDGKVSNCRLGVVKDERLTEDTPMYEYPFSNVSGFSLCIGNNALPKYKKLSTIGTLPRILLSIPNNDDSYHFGQNKLKLSYRELLNHLKNKEPGYYYTDILIPSGKTLKDFIGR